MISPASSQHLLDTPSSWITRFAPLIPIGEAEVLDLACGSGRHARWLAQQGHRVRALDRDGAALARTAGPGIETLQHDLEAHEGEDARTVWPFAPAQFKAVVVANYLHRPLFPLILESLAPGGLLLYETFAAGNGQFGKPSNPAFLLQPGELLEWRHSGQKGQHPMRIVAFEDGHVTQPRPAMVQRLCALKLDGESSQVGADSQLSFSPLQLRLF